MSITYTDGLRVEIKEKEIITVDIVEKELVKVELRLVDMVAGRNTIIDAIQQYYIHNESPTRVGSKRFRTVHSYVANSLVVYLNGIKEKYITEISDTDFDFLIDTLSEDIVEVTYIQQ